MHTAWPPARYSRRALLSAAVLTVAPALSSAQGFPSQPVRLLLGAPAGSAPDLIARSFAEALSPALGQPVLVENRPGAGGSLATTAVAAAAPDGHTLNVSGCSGDAITHALTAQGRAPLGLFRDLTPVARLMRDHWLVLVPAGSEAASLDDLGRKAKAGAEPTAYPSQGEGSTPHLQGERLARTIGFKALHVPYKESPVNDLVGGRLGYAVLPSASAVSLVKGGRLRALAVLSAERLAALPEVPTADEAGLPSYTFNGGLCAWVPGGTPPALQARLNEALAEAARQPSLRERLQTLGADATPYTLDETARYVREFAAESEQLRTDVFGATR